jgi:tetratricopeptide (TPR) repeat protein
MAGMPFNHQESSINNKNVNKLRTSPMFGHRNTFLARMIALLVVSLALVLTVGCSRDPNVRKQKFLDSGKKYEADGKYREAAIQFSNAIKLDHSFAPAYFELAKVDLKLDSLMPAFQSLLKTVDLDPKNLEARIMLGNMLLAGGAPDRAAIQANAALAVNPNYADAYALLAGVAARKGNRGDALTNIQKAIALDPNKSSYHSGMAMLLSSNPDDQANAEAEMRKAASLDPKSATPHLMLAATLQKKGDIQGANQEYRAAIAAAPTNMAARQALANLYLKNGDKAGAEQTLLQAVTDMPDTEAAAGLLAGFYGSTGQIDRAETVFSGLTSKYPKSFGIKLVYARILFDKKEYDKVGPLITQLSKVDAGNPQVQTLNAMLMVNTGKVDDAFALMKKSGKDNPNNLQVQLLLAKIAMTKGDSTTAESSWRQADKLSPGNLEAASGLAQIAMAHGDVASLSDIADKTIHSQPNYLGAYMWRGMAEASRKEYDKADSDYQYVIKNSPDNAVGYLEMALLRIAQGRTADAKTMLQTTLDKDPNSARALGILMQYDFQAKQPDKALQRVQAQIAKEPNNGSFYVLQGAAQMHLKDFKGALDSGQKAMQLSPADPAGAQVYTEAQVATGNIEPAISVWQKWLTTHPNDVNALNVVGSLEEARGDQDKAMEYYKKTLAIDSGNPVASNNLAYLMVQAGQNVDVALSMAQSARRSLPNSPQTADTLAWIYYYKGNYFAARDLLESALKETPDNASMQLHLGLTYVKLNRNTDAIPHLKKAASIDPSSKVAQDANAALSKLG